LAGAALGGKDHALEYGAGGAAAGYLVAQPFLTSFTASDENQADKFGFAIYSQAGWDPNKFGDFFQHLIDAGNSATAGGDHPPLGERVKNAERRASELSPKSKAWAKPDTASPQQFAGYVAKSKQYTASVPKDKSTQQAQTLLSAFPSCVTVDNQPSQVKARQEIQDTLDAAQKQQEQQQQK
jgi:predicted Zn-dependent protease